VRADKATFLYTGDYEIAPDPEAQLAAREMLGNVDLAIVDSMYSRSNFKPGWGHSCWEDWRDVWPSPAGGCILLSHHAPQMTDRQMDVLQRELLLHCQQSGSRLCIAREGMRLRLPLPEGRACGECGVIQFSNWLDSFLDELTQYLDEATLLDCILAKAREISRADAGTVFLVDGANLQFAYTHNDSLFSVSTASKFAYSSTRFPITHRSIAGYAAATGETLNLGDVRALRPELPFSFTEDFYHAWGYSTQSMLVVPFLNHAGKVLGVMQLINSLDPCTGKPRPFNKDMEGNIQLLAHEITNILERSKLVRASINRLIRLTSVHDPLETGPHAERVGALAAEMYQAWANRRGLDRQKTLRLKSQIRLAAMLHDIGKVGVSDLLLKKPGRLSEAEMAVMRSHTTIGAAILAAEGAYAGIMAMAGDIARHHHQKWNGQGYAGPTSEDRLSGEDIPLAARITAIADVFDALVSPRSYKKCWTHEKALRFLHEEAGTHFDPTLVDCLDTLMDVVTSIYERYPDVACPKG